jgi:hypothetical protein
MPDQTSKSVSQLLREPCDDPECCDPKDRPRMKNDCMCVVDLTEQALSEIERLDTLHHETALSLDTMTAERDRLRAALAGMIEAVRSVEINGKEWKAHVSHRLSTAYQVLGLTSPAIAALAARDSGHET